MSELRDAIAFDALDDVRVDCMAYCYGGSIDKREAADAVLAMPEMQAIRKALQAAETVIAHADDPARQQTKIEYLSWALADLSDAVQAWVLEDEQ